MVRCRDRDTVNYVYLKVPSVIHDFKCSLAVEMKLILFDMTDEVMRYIAWFVVRSSLNMSTLTPCYVGILDCIEWHVLSVVKHHGGDIFPKQSASTYRSNLNYAVKPVCNAINYFFLYVKYTEHITQTAYHSQAKGVGYWVRHGINIVLYLDNFHGLDDLYANVTDAELGGNMVSCKCFLIILFSSEFRAE